MSMWLIGMMGSGKTTVGERVAAVVGAPFYDTDVMVEEMAGMSVAETWEQVGEVGFREMEHRAVAAVPSSGAVAAAGGGAVLDPVNRQNMRSGGRVVWLRCTPELAAKRVGSDPTRPLLNGDMPVEDRLAVILEERSGVYSSVATDLVDTDNRSVDEVVSDVVRMWSG